MNVKTDERKPRRGRGGAPNEPGLSREIVVDAALAYIDENGLESFSLRNLANRLGVYPTAIYWHVPTKNELLGQVVARVLGKVLANRKRRSWQAFIRDLFTSFRAVIREHPNVAPLVGTQLVSNTSMSLEFVEQVLAALSRAGLSGEKLVGAYNMVIATIVGFVAQEFAPLPSEDSASWQETVRDRLAGISRENYPVLASNLALLSNRAFILRWQNGADAPLDDSFRIYVDAVVSGLEAIIEKP